MKNSMKKLFALLLTVVMVMGCMAIGASADEVSDWSYWDGISVDVTPFEGKDPKVDYDPAKGHTPIIIETAAQLAGLAKVVNESGQGGGQKGAYRGWPIYITKNIDLDTYKFTPIGMGYTTAAFGGFLEGRLNGEEGKPVTIKNLYISEGNPVYTPDGKSKENVNNAFIPTLRNGGVMNLTFENAKVGHPNASGDTGIVVGYFSKNGSVFSGVTVKNSTLITGYGSKCSGGVIANLKNENIDLIKDVHAENLTIVSRITDDGAYIVERQVGGIVGSWTPAMPLTLENCSFSGKLVKLDSWDAIEGDMYIGGFVGTTMGGKDLTFKNCEYTGELAYIGENREASNSAFVGYHAGGESVITIENGTVSGTCDALVGSDGAVKLNITNVTATSQIVAVKGGADHTVTGEITFNIPEPPATEPQPTEPQGTEPQGTEPKPTEPKTEEPAPSGGNGLVWGIVGAVIGAAIVLAVGALTKKKN